MSGFGDLFSGGKPLIGMIHLPPLPGYAGTAGIEQAVAQAVADLRVLEDGGIDAVLVENEYDRPHRVTAAPDTVAAMTRITRAVVEEARSVVVGCEILLNDPKASLAVASMSGARFIRTDYFVDAMTRPEYGEFAIDPSGLIEYRRAIGADDILIFADIQVKYATMIEPRPLGVSARIACEQHADALVISGTETGDAPLLDQLREASQASTVPVLVGSGLSAANANGLLEACDGAIVGTSLMRNRRPDAAAVLALKSATSSRKQ
jgi:hypothetical protein